ncbi:hypothetical protein ACS0TY_008280 [Phlomoides rotata]
MFPSFNCDDNSSSSIIKKSSSDHHHHQNPRSTSPSLFNFPSPFLDEHESPLNQIFFQTLHHSSHMTTTTTTNNDPEKSTKRNSKESSRRRSLGIVPRRRTGKKDRHSKICTAQGVRDRRMRLSLQVARKFFDLQDMLGYDKASKTIEWLFTKSKKAIKDLINEHTQANNSDVKSESFLSECEVVSGSVHELENNTNTIADGVMPPQVKKSSTRESREMARARARCRTREKMMEKYCLQINPDHQQKLGFSPFEGTVLSPYDESDQQKFADVGTIEKFLGNSSSSSPVSWPTSENSSAADFMGFFGNWDLLNGERSSSIFSVTNQVSLAGNPSDEFIMHK